MRRALSLFIALLIFFVIIGVFLVISFLSLVINGVVLYFVILALLKDFKKKSKYSLYLVPAVISLIVVFFLGKLVPFLWRATTFLVLMYLIAQLVQMIRKR